LDNSQTNQLAVSQFMDWLTRRQVNVPKIGGNLEFVITLKCPLG